MGEEMRGLASPPHPQGRTESCTLRILRMLLRCGCAAVDYVAPPLWITWLRRCGLRGSATVDYAPAVLWIMHLRCCGLCTCGAVDYDASHLWIREGKEKWGLASPPHPQGRTQSCRGAWGCVSPTTGVRGRA